MPAGDRTGPLGNGPLTGRGTGYCGDRAAGAASWAAQRPCYGRWLDRGGGVGGRGWRNRFYATGQPGWVRTLPEDELPASRNPALAAQALKDQATALQSELDLVKQRLAQVEAEDKTE